MEELLQKLKKESGALVSTKDCSPFEIAIAQTQGNMFVDADGCGFILRPQIWLDSVKALSESLTAQLSELFS